MTVQVSEIEALSERVHDVPLASERLALRLVVYGEPGVGKTSLALSFPRPLIINTDMGLEGDALAMLEESGGKEITPDGYKDLEALYFWIRDRADQFDTIIVDSLDTVVSKLLANIVDEGVGKRQAKDVGVSVLDYVPEQAEYLANQGQIERVLDGLRLLRKHIVITSAVRPGKNPGDRRFIDTAPGVARIVDRWASVMGELVVTALEEGGPQLRVLNTNPGSERSKCKTRYRALLPYVVIPEDGGYDEIVTRIMSGRTAAE